MKVRAAPDCSIIECYCGRMVDRYFRMRARRINTLLMIEAIATGPREDLNISRTSPLFYIFTLAVSILDLLSSRKRGMSG